MADQRIDWKDYANAQFDKALSLALVFMLFGIMVTPKIQAKKQKYDLQQMELVDIPMEEREKIKPPETDVKIDVQIQISDDLGSSSSVDVAAYEQALSQIGDIFKTSTSTSKSSDNEKPFNFTPYDIPPEFITPPKVEYPSWAKDKGIRGIVYLEVDVYKDGSVGEIRVRKSVFPGLDEIAINAVKKAKFQPGKSSGQPVDTTVMIPIEF